MYTIGRVLHAGISVRDMDQSIAWYREILGFTLCKDDGFVPALGARICFLQKDGFQLELFEYQDPRPIPEERLWPNTDLQTIGTKHVAFAVSGMEALKAAFAEKGVFIAHETRMNGEHVLFIRDCSGTLIELIEAAAEPTD